MPLTPYAPNPICLQPHMPLTKTPRTCDFYFLITVNAINLARTMVIFNLRKKHWLNVKSQICLPGSKFAFPRTWPCYNMNLERGHVFIFSIFAIPMQICDFTSKGWWWRSDFSSFFLHWSSPYHYDQNWKKRFCIHFFRKASFQYPFINKPFRNSNSYHEFLSLFGTRNAHLKFSVSY